MNNAVKPPANNAAAVKQPQFRAVTGEKLSYPGGFPVYLSRYVVFGGDKPRVALRFFNASDVLVTGLRFRLTEKDSSGRVIAEYSLERTGLFAERGCEFPVADAPVGAACAFVGVRLESVISAPYEYTVEGDGVKVVYGTKEREPEYFFRKKAGYSVKKYRKTFIWVSIVSVLAAAMLAALTVWKTGVFDRFSDRESADAEPVAVNIIRER